MKVVLINGSPKKEGNTFIALSEVARTLEENGVETRIISIGKKAVQGCIACNKCSELGRCVFSDDLYNEVREALKDAEGLQTMRTLARNMVWMLRNLKDGGYPIPEQEEWIATNFIR